MTSAVSYTGELRTLATHLHSSSHFETDAPLDNQGKGERFSPTDLVGTALASCIITTIAIRAKEFESRLVGVVISTEKIMAINPRRISVLNLSFTWPKSSRFDEEEQININQIAETCPVKESIHPSIEVNISYNWES